MRGRLKIISDQLADRVAEALARARDDGALSFDELPEVRKFMEVPREREHGDLACTVALALASEAKVSPRRIGEAILERLDRDYPYLDRAEIAGPGFLNFHLKPLWLEHALRDILSRGEDWGRTDHGGNLKIQVEFVSANPTGPMVVVQARSGAVGDVLANLLDAAGYDVSREFYINDAGTQVDHLGESLEVRYRQLLGEDVELPPDGYPGEYLVDIARKLLEEKGPCLMDHPEEERRRLFKDYAVREIVAWQRRDLEAYGVKFDVWFSERTLYETGALADVIEELKRRGYTREEGGALWFRSTEFGDDKDRVLLRREAGAPTYLTADIAYHRNKFQRGFEKVIDIWGPDHHGYIARMKAAVQALGHPADALEVLIVQWVKLMKGGEAVKMSKRGGQFILMSDLVEEVGVDAARFFFLMRSPDSPMEFDMDLAVEQSDENPVYYVQYAHARLASIFRRAEEEGYRIPAPEEADLSLLQHEAERDLIRLMAALPEEIIEAAESREPHRMTRYALNLATKFHVFYTQCRVLDRERPDLTAARLVLAGATKMVLGNVLRLLGVSAPESM